MAGGATFLSELAACTEELEKADVGCTAVARRLEFGDDFYYSAPYNYILRVCCDGCLHWNLEVKFPWQQPPEESIWFKCIKCKKSCRVDNKQAAWDADITGGAQLRTPAPFGVA